MIYPAHSVFPGKATFHPMPDQCWADVAYVGTYLSWHWLNVSCLPRYSCADVPPRICIYGSSWQKFLHSFIFPGITKLCWFDVGSDLKTVAEHWSSIGSMFFFLVPARIVFLVPTWFGYRSDQICVTQVVHIQCSNLFKGLECAVLSMVLCTIKNTWSHSISLGIVPTWQYRDRRKPEADTMPYSYSEWLQGFFMVHSTIGRTVHSIPLNSLEHCICTTTMTNIRPDRDSNLVPQRYKLQSIQMSHRGRSAGLVRRQMAVGLSVVYKLAQRL